MFGQYLNDQLGRNEMYLTKKGILVAAIFMSKNLYTDLVMFGQYFNDQLGRNEMYLTKKGILVAAIFMSKNLYTDICRWHMMARMYSS
jgi:hypothetical protein